MDIPILQVLNISLSYTNARSTTEALRSVSFILQQGETVSVIGPSGCGKTSLLLLCSGLLRPTAGTVESHGVPITHPSSKRVVIFQDHALFPWKTALENILFVLRIRGIPALRIHEEAQRYLKLVGLPGYASHYPGELSGGMQQRVGIARALSADPDILLFDEPFASLDHLTRNTVLQELRAVMQRLKKSAILVTHDIEEAIYCGDRILVMSPSPGKIETTITVPFRKPDTIARMKTLGAYRNLERKIQRLLDGVAAGKNRGT